MNMPTYERYEELVFRLLSDALLIDPLYTIERQYSKHGCKNKSALLFDFAVMYNGILRCYIEAMENPHFSIPNVRSNIFRAIDDKITFLITENEFIKWKCQILQGVPIIYVNEYQYDRSDKEGITKFLIEHVSKITNITLMNNSSREALFLKEYYLKLPATRINIKETIHPEKYSAELLEFVQYYNNGKTHLWIKQNLLNDPELNNR
ncbi:hypothetical protein [Paenibacillus sp. FSL L8-0499]|uniref:hypothetical protein n=1 Tax=Paenibacillus sp. FSL L8-0499 TaxID=2975334 RepID=UPI0030FBE316